MDENEIIVTFALDKVGRDFIMRDRFLSKNLTKYVKGGLSLLIFS